VKLATGITKLLTETKMTKALDGINVVEFESHLGAAYAAMLLAEQGARAIKVEACGGSPLRGTPHFHVLNRSKRVLDLDMDASASAPQVAELLRWADVVITGFTPERLAALFQCANCLLKHPAVALRLQMKQPQRLTGAA